MQNAGNLKLNNAALIILMKRRTLFGCRRCQKQSLRSYPYYAEGFPLRHLLSYDIMAAFAIALLELHTELN